MDPALSVRSPVPDDYARTVDAVPAWWSDSRAPQDIPQLQALVQPLFLEHFADSCRVVVAESGALVAFLIGFLSQSRPAEAYIDFIGVHPQHRKSGLARELYAWFFAFAAAHDRTVVGAITSPGNTGSIAFHRSMGFAVDDSGAMVQFRRTIG